MQSFASRARRGRAASTLAVLLALSALSTGCVQPGRQQSVVPSVSPITATTATTGTAQTRVSSHRNVDGRSLRHTITQSELESVIATTAYELVLRLRPEFLRYSTRQLALGSHAEPVVYIDALKTGLVSTLAMIPVSHVLDITYVTPVDAMLRYGPTHGTGAIVVRTRR